MDFNDNALRYETSNEVQLDILKAQTRRANFAARSENLDTVSEDDILQAQDSRRVHVAVNEHNDYSM